MGYPQHTTNSIAIDNHKLSVCMCVCALTTSAGQEPEPGQPEKHSSVYYMGIYAAISGAQLMILQINFYCVVTFGIRAGR